jgi:L-alanine-DL-glutamate epimerase-like enolase superfamily enzyme
MLEMDAGRIINLKIGRVGGLTESLKIIDFCGKTKYQFGAVACLKLA